MRACTVCLRSCVFHATLKSERHGNHNKATLMFVCIVVPKESIKSLIRDAEDRAGLECKKKGVEHAILRAAVYLGNDNFDDKRVCCLAFSILVYEDGTIIAADLFLRCCAWERFQSGSQLMLLGFILSLRYV